jgi:transcription antitermination factor NusG
MTAQWYALHSKPMKEALLSEQLGLHHFESYYPCLHVKPVNPRSRKTRPYFPGYIFGRIDLEQSNLPVLQWMPGSAGIVAFDGVPSHVPENMIVAIRRRVDEINTAGAGCGELFDGLKSGDMVTIQDGPFKGYEAIFNARLSGDERVRVLLKILNRQQFPLELPGGQIQRKKQ